VQEGTADGTEIVKALMKQLRIKDVKKLETIPYARLADAYNKVSPKVRAQGHYVGGTPQPGDWYLGDPVHVGFTEHAKTIPVMVGTVLGEFSFMPALDEAVKNDEAAIDKKLAKRYGADSVEELKKLFAETYPNKHISDLLFVDSVMRGPSSRFAAAKAKHPESETYTYLFTYTFPYDGGHIAWHCSEIPFVFHNTSLVALFNEEGVTEMLEKRMCDAWLNFARTGKPSSEDLPEWPACTADDEAVMIFDKECEVRHNYDHELIALHKKASPPWGAPPAKDDDEEEQKIQH
jgi:para-nitrobenzyl esterase